MSVTRLCGTGLIYWMDKFNYVHKQVSCRSTTTTRWYLWLRQINTLTEHRKQSPKTQQWLLLKYSWAVECNCSWGIGYKIHFDKKKAIFFQICNSKCTFNILVEKCRNSWGHKAIILKWYENMRNMRVGAILVIFIHCGLLVGVDHWTNID